MTASAPGSWPPLGAVPPAALVEARLQAHHAAQVVVAVGISLLPPRPDDSHTNLEWLPGEGALASRPAPGRTLFRVALRFRDLALLFCDAEGAVRVAYALDGRTVAEAMNWLLGEVARAGGDADRLTARKHYAIPAHPVGSGAPFTAPAGALAELAAYYGGAATVLGALAARTPGAAEVRCWPHHFDLATLLTVAGAGEGAGTIGAGLSPGDEHYAEPYYYVTPYPYPAARPLPDLPAGHWHTAGWTGAVLTGSELLRAGGGAGQPQCVAAFLTRAVEAGRRLLSPDF